MGRNRFLPNAENATRAELKTAMDCTPKKENFIRLNAIYWLLAGMSADVVRAISHCSVSTLSRWIKQFNAQGIDGLLLKKSPGRPRKIPKEKMAQLVQRVRHPEMAHEVHWTAKKFHGHLRENLQIEVGYSTVVRWLHEQNFRLKVPQPWPDRQDETLRNVFIERVKTWLQDEAIDLWYQDEMGVEGDPRPRRRWVLKGEKARVTRNGDHLRMSTCGIICPRTGEFFALEFDRSDSETFQIFLDEANRSLVCSRRRNLLIMDNASWHKRNSFRWGAFEPIFLPPYSPDLNPIEKLWLVIKGEWFADFIAKNREALIARLDQALTWAIHRQTENQHTCAIRQ